MNDTRRNVIKLITGGAISLIMVSGNVSAESHESGYGLLGYGEDTYGHVEEDDDNGDVTEPESEPVIIHLSGEDTSNPRNPHADILIGWSAEIEDGELSDAELEVTNNDGEIVMTDSYTLSGQSAEETSSDRIHHGSGDAYTATLVVRSGHGTESTEIRTFFSL